MNFDEYLRLGGIDRELLVSSVRDLIGYGEDDILLAVGSVVEGLGNTKSDLDLFLLTLSAGRGREYRVGLGQTSG